jgi:hypothetical protein
VRASQIVRIFRTGRRSSLREPGDSPEMDGGIEQNPAYRTAQTRNFQDVYPSFLAVYALMTPRFTPTSLKQPRRWGSAGQRDKDPDKDHGRLEDDLRDTMTEHLHSKVEAGVKSRAAGTHYRRPGCTPATSDRVATRAARSARDARPEGEASCAPTTRRPLGGLSASLVGSHLRQIEHTDKPGDARAFARDREACHV